eukprot:140660-Hanusia_phi.AAC.2
MSPQDRAAPPSPRRCLGDCICFTSELDRISGRGFRDVRRVFNGPSHQSAQAPCVIVMSPR